jgi:hypothetical protein
MSIINNIDDIYMHVDVHIYVWIHTCGCAVFYYSLSLKV